MHLRAPKISKFPAGGHAPIRLQAAFGQPVHALPTKIFSGYATVNAYYSQQS